MYASGRIWSSFAGGVLYPWRVLERERGFNRLWKLERVVSMGGELMSSGMHHSERWFIRFGAFDEAVLDVRCESMLSMARQVVSAGSGVHELLLLDWVDIGGGISTERVSA